MAGGSFGIAPPSVADVGAGDSFNDASPARRLAGAAHEAATREACGSGLDCTSR